MAEPGPTREADELERLKRSLELARAGQQEALKALEAARAAKADATREAAELKARYQDAEAELLALQRASNEMIATQYLDDVLRSILSGVEEGLGYDLALLMVLDRKGGYFFARANPENVLVIGAKEDGGAAIDRLRVPLAAENALARLVATPTLAVHESAEPLLRGAEPAEDARRLWNYLHAKGMRAFAAVPMIVRGEVAGSLMCCRAKTPLRERERESLQNFSNQAGMAIENAQLVNDMRRVRDELAQNNETLRRTNEKLIELERAKEVLTSMLVHDMKNPLTGIRGYLELLLDETLPDNLRNHVKMSYESSGRLLAMVRDLLDISKMEAGRFSVSAETVDLIPLIEGAHSEQSVVAQRQSKSIRLSLHPDLPLIKGDGDLIGRVIANLLSNSVKHTPQGSTIELSARPAALHPGSPGDAAVVLGFADNGEGIPPEFHEKIFEKYTSLEPRSSKSAPKMSTGLGLTFCKMAVEAHGGKLWLQSEPGKGATFWVALPEAPPQAAAG